MKQSPRLSLPLVLALSLFATTNCAIAQQSRSRGGLRNSSAVRDAFRAPAAAAAKSTVRVLVNGKSVALGCVVTKEGEVLTKASLVAKGDVSIRIGNGNTVSATRMGTDKQSDLMLLKASSGEYTPMEFAGASPPVGRMVAAPAENGEILGAGMVALEESPSLRSPKTGVAPVRMGVSLRSDDGGGVRVTQPVEPNEPAYRAGVRLGDVIKSIDGYKVNAREDVVRILRKHKPGDRIALRVDRNGESRKTDIRLAGFAIDQWGGGPFSKRRFDFPRVITHDITISRTLCGGPLVTSDGEVVGINIARALRIASYALPSEIVTGVLGRLRAQAARKATAGSSASKLPVPPAPQKVAAGKGVRQVGRTEPIVAAGVRGSLFLTNGDVPKAVIERFMDLARRQQAQVVVVSGEGDNDLVSEIEAVWKEKEGKSFDRIILASDDATNASEQLKKLEDATAVWVTASVPMKSMQNTKLAKALGKLRASGTIPLAMPMPMAATTHITDTSKPGLSILPDSIATTSESSAEAVAESFRENPHLVNYTFASGTCLFVRGRYLFAMGGTVKASFAPSTDWPEKTVVMEGRRLGDLTALRRFATRRNGPLFPPQKPEEPNVANGTLMIVGGGGMPKGLTEQFLKEAGGDEAVICIIPISMPASQVPERSRMGEYFTKLGAKEVHVLKQRTPEESDSKEVLDILKRTTGVWFGGGRQWRFIDAYEGTKAAQLMHDVLKRGGVIGGSSAGASIQGDYMARGNPLGPRDIMADGYESGLRFLKGVAIDQHFTQRNRLPDMSSLMKTYPQLLGIGIDETTAIIVKKNIAEVVGRNRVCFYDRRKPVSKDGPDFEPVKAGGKYDLVARKIIEQTDSDADSEPKSSASP